MRAFGHKIFYDVKNLKILMPSREEKTKQHNVAQLMQVEQTHTYKVPIYLCTLFSSVTTFYCYDSRNTVVLHLPLPNTCNIANIE